MYQNPLCLHIDFLKLFFIRIIKYKNLKYFLILMKKLFCGIGQAIYTGMQTIIQDVNL